MQLPSNSGNLFHEDLSIFQVGARFQNSYFIPFSNGQKVELLAAEISNKPEIDLRKHSDRLQFLNGNWYFQYYDSYRSVPKNFGLDPCLKNISQQTIPVPSNWQNHGFGRHQYINIRYPFPIDPPYVPDENPCGAYETYFEVDEDFAEYDAHLTFEGIDSCIYLWINGEFVGYNQVSHDSYSFDISDYLQTGVNILQALVLKFSDGSYLEDQDKFRMSGIYRDVYITYRPKTHIEDFEVKYDLSDDLNSVTLSVNFQINNASENKVDALEVSKIADDIEIKLYDPASDEILANFKVDEELYIEDIRLWNAEDPYLYTLIVTCEDEAFMQEIGFRKITIVNDVLYLNNQNIKLKGTNRHDSDPISGYHITTEQLIYDLELMKKHNINAIRTAHYPNAPWAYEYFSRFGFYVIDEADIEMHGSVEMYGGRSFRRLEPELYFTDTYSYLSNQEIFYAAQLDRIKRMAYRDRNQSSIIIWSLGNEAGYGPGLEVAAKWLKNFDDTRPIQYESALYRLPYFESNVEVLDFASHMYPELSELDEYVKQDEAKKPYLMIEYIHAMGNGPGDIEGYWDRIYKYDCMTGGFAWEWSDHAIYKGKSDNGYDIFYYGGDNGEDQHDSNFCVDGLVKPNREISQGLEEYANVIRPIRVIDSKDLASKGKIKVMNMLDFIDAGSEYIIKYEYVSIDEKICFGNIVDFELNPRESEVFDLALTDEEFASIASYKNQQLPIYLNVYYLYVGGHKLIDNLRVMGHDQIIVYEPELFDKAKIFDEFYITENIESIEYIEHEKDLLIKGDNFLYTFDKYKGIFSQLVFNQERLISKPIEYNFWRAPIDNDMYIKHDWQRAGIDRLISKLKMLSIESVENGVEIKTHLSFAPKGLQVVAEVNTTWLINHNGQIDVSIDVNRDRTQPWYYGNDKFPLTDAEKNRVDDGFPYLPRFGLRLFLEEEFNNICYLGLGPNPAYLDMHSSTIKGKHSSTIAQEYVDFIKPQEHGSHCGTNGLIIHKNYGGAILICPDKEISFNASYYSQEELASKAHNYELEKSGSTILCIDYKMSGLGSNSCGPLTRKEYRLNEEEFSFKLQIVPGKVEK